MFSAVLDTSVLWPSLQRDFLLSLAAEGSYRPLWSSVILEELEYHEAQKLIDRGEAPDAAEAAARYLIDQMQTAFDDAEVADWEPLEGTYGIPDPDDEHVVAAAAKTGAEVIVTSNLKDFPPALMPPGVRAISPQEFVYDTVRHHQTLACRAVIEISRRSGKQGPRLEPARVLTILSTRYGMGEIAELLYSAPALRNALKLDEL